MDRIFEYNFISPSRQHKLLNEKAILVKNGQGSRTEILNMATEEIQSYVDTLVENHFFPMSQLPDIVRLRKSRTGSSEGYLLSELTNSVNDYLQKEGVIKRNDRRTAHDCMAKTLVQLGYYQESLYSFLRNQ